MNKFIATIARVPTSFSSPFKVCIEARDIKHATERLYKLYSNDIYSGIGCNMSESIRQTDDPDEWVNARFHPCPECCKEASI